MRVITTAVIVTLALALLSVPQPGEAQPAARVAKLGLLGPGVGRPRPYMQAFLQELRERGWVEGENLAIERRYAQGKIERLPALAAELVNLEVDVIFAPSVPAAQAARQATTTIPIVFEMLADPVDIGLVSNFPRPEENLTGISGFNVELSGKWLELLRAVVPGVRRVAVLTNPSSAHALSIVHGIERAAQTLDMRLFVVEAQNSSELDQAFASMTRSLVVNKRGGLEGIMTVDDVLELLGEAFGDLAALVKREREKEAKRVR